MWSPSDAPMEGKQRHEQAQRRGPKSVAPPSQPPRTLRVHLPVARPRAQVASRRHPLGGCNPVALAGHVIGCHQRQGGAAVPHSLPRPRLAAWHKVLPPPPSPQPRLVLLKGGTVGLNWGVCHLLGQRAVTSRCQLTTRRRRIENSIVFFHGAPSRLLHSTDSFTSSTF